MKLIICGDLSVTATSCPAFEKQDKEAAFGDALPVFSKADRVFVNLECALTDSEHRIKKCGPNPKGPKTTADTLKAAGVTDCMLSNNHIFDFGKPGAEDTLEQLDRVGLGYTGYGKNYEDSRKNYFVEHEGVKIGVVNVCEHEYSYATDDREGARPFDEFETMEDIRQAKKLADHVIVIYHGGMETTCRRAMAGDFNKAKRYSLEDGADEYQMFAHYLDCEAHADVWRELFKTYNHTNELG